MPRRMSTKPRLPPVSMQGPILRGLEYKRDRQGLTEDEAEYLDRLDAARIGRLNYRLDRQEP